MPKYVIHNPTPCLVQIPGTSIFVKPKSNLTLDVQPGVMETSGMQTLLAGGHLRMRTVVESPLINDHIEGVVVDMLTGGTGSGDGWDRTGVRLGVTGDVRVFTVPDIFVHDTSGVSIEVFHQGGGRRLQLSPTGNPCDGDYILEESGGVGTGYDTVKVISFTPKGLKANYKTV